MEPAYSNIVAPVIEEEIFKRMKIELMGTLETNKWLLGFKESKYNPPRIKKYSFQKLLKQENDAYSKNKNISLLELEKKIKKNKKKKFIAVESKQFYRDPEVAIYAQKRANGICECCGENAPFTNDLGRPFLESHHLIPLSNDGEDTIENICAVCPNCHRKLHFGPDREQLTIKIINDLNYGKDINPTQ